MRGQDALSPPKRERARRVRGNGWKPPKNLAAPSPPRRLAFASASTDPHRTFFSKPGAEKIKTKVMLSVPMFLRSTQV